MKPTIRRERRDDNPDNPRYAFDFLGRLHSVWRHSLSRRELSRPPLILALALLLLPVQALGDGPWFREILDIIPPVEYDHPYEGFLVVNRTSNLETTRERCNKAAFPHTLPRNAIACAVSFKAATTREGFCLVFIPPDEVLAKYNISYDLAYRHEMAHCNGWPADHSR